MSPHLAVPFLFSNLLLPYSSPSVPLLSAAIETFSHSFLPSIRPTKSSEMTNEYRRPRGCTRGFFQGGFFLGGSFLGGFFYEAFLLREQKQAMIPLQGNDKEYITLVLRSYYAHTTLVLDSYYAGSRPPLRTYAGSRLVLDSC